MDNNNKYIFVNIKKKEIINQYLVIFGIIISLILNIITQNYNIILFCLLYFVLLYSEPCLIISSLLYLYLIITLFYDIFLEWIFFYMYNDCNFYVLSVNVYILKYYIVLLANLVIILIKIILIITLKYKISMKDIINVIYYSNNNY